MTIYVIIENVGCDPESDNAPYECLCYSLGYYTDHRTVEKVVEELNYDYCRKKTIEHGCQTVEDTNRFDFVALDPGIE